MTRYAVYTSPLGSLFVLATDSGICRLTWDENEVLDKIRVCDIVPKLRSSLSSYFRGVKESFDYPLDLSSLSTFTQEVLKEVKKIPYGKRKTYGEIAEIIGRGSAQRAVGRSVAKNPIPIIIPCHRVIARDGIGGYARGVGVKLGLLLLEKRSALTPSHIQQ